MSDIGIMLVFGCILLLLLGLLKFFAWLTELQEAHGSLPRAAGYAIQRYVVVKHSQDQADNVMSRSDNDGPSSAPSSLQTDSRQTTDRPALAVPSRDVMLNTCKTLRKYGMPREEARVMLKSMGLPLDNNLWADAAPVGDELVHVTPIVGRRTNAVFETDPDYPYQAPT